MHSITLNSYVGSDGILKIHLPEMRETDVEVVIVYQTRSTKEVEAKPLSEFYGCIQDESFLRHSQLEAFERESLE